MKILIADDELVSRRLLEATLSNSGHDLIVCSDGTEAWNAVQRDDPTELFILDWMMLGMDGLELCRRVRKSPKGTSAYIIILTARGRTDDIMQGVLAGADDYVMKPFDQEDLLMRVQVGECLVQAQEGSLKQEA